MGDGDQRDTRLNKVKRGFKSGKCLLLGKTVSYRYVERYKTREKLTLYGIVCTKLTRLGGVAVYM